MTQFLLFSYLRQLGIAVSFEFFFRLGMLIVEKLKGASCVLLTKTIFSNNVLVAFMQAMQVKNNVY